MDQFESHGGTPPGVIHFWSIFTECPFLCMQGKGNAACGWVRKWKFSFQKCIACTANGPILISQVLVHLTGCHLLLACTLHCVQEEGIVLNAAYTCVESVNFLCI